jgi:hypothetical protein
LTDVSRIQWVVTTLPRKTVIHPDDTSTALHALFIKMVILRAEAAVNTPVLNEAPDPFLDRSYGRADMNFDAFSGNRRSRRLTSVDHSPAMIESLESRALLAAAGPSIISPTGSIGTSQPTITWQATLGATSYDLWIADTEARERIVFKEGIAGTSTTLTVGDRLRLGGNRMWIRATLADGSKTEWGTPADVRLRARPVVVGPTNPANPAAPNRIETNDWTVTWNSPTGATQFEVFVSNQTERTSKIYTVPNQVQMLDANGDAILDGAGNPVLQEVRSLFLDGAVDIIGAAPQVVSNAVNRSFIDITSDNHGLVTGDKVRVSGVLGNTGANGDYTVTVISENVFRLNNAVNTGTYTSGGRWVRLVGNSPATGMSPRIIAGVTKSSAIDLVVTNHGLKTGEKVRITGVGGNTAANGTFLVTVLNANTIQLRGITGTSVFTQNGQLVRLTQLQSKLELGKYRIFVRSTDDGGRVSGWSVARDIEITPVVNVLRPQGPTFETQPLLQWDAVSSATHYQVEVYRVGETTPLYTAPFLTTNSYRIPETLSTTPVQFFEFRVRAFRLHQVTTITPSGDPATGSFILSLTTSGKTPVTVQTAPINYNATADDIQNAVRNLTGFEKATVIAQGEAPNTVFLLQLPLTGNAGNPGVIGGNPVKVTVISNVSPGTVTGTTVVSTRVDGQWSPLVSFSTIQKPVITAPLGVDTPDPAAPRTVTDLRPTIRWTAIDKAARYEVWVERLASTSTFLRTNASVNSYQFQEDLISGKYTVRVRAVSTTGQFTDWSELYAFTATGGASIVQSVTIAPTRQATVTWAAVAEADSYEVQIAKIGTNIDFIHPTGITVTKYTTTVALPVGNYRVWVRGVKADGTFLNWSKPVDFVVVETEAIESTNADGGLVALLTSELSDENASAPQPTEESPADSSESLPYESENAPGSHNDLAMIVSPEAVPASFESTEKSEEDLLIEHLAQACTKQEWWTTAENVSA